MNRYWPNAWVDACIDVWSDPRFMDYVEDADFVDCWREVASPEFCQPEGGSCGRNLASGWPPGLAAKNTLRVNQRNRGKNVATGKLHVSCAEHATRSGLTRHLLLYPFTCATCSPLWVFCNR
jgi:hypothetical protein